MFEVSNESWRDQVLKNIVEAMCEVPDLPDEAWSRLDRLFAASEDVAALAILDWAKRCRDSRRKITALIEQIGSTT